MTSFTLIALPMIFHYSVKYSNVGVLFQGGCFQPCSLDNLCHVTMPSCHFQPGCLGTHYLRQVSNFNPKIWTIHLNCQHDLTSRPDMDVGPELRSCGSLEGSTCPQCRGVGWEKGLHRGTYSCEPSGCEDCDGHTLL